VIHKSRLVFLSASHQHALVRIASSGRRDERGEERGWIPSTASSMYKLG